MNNTWTILVIGTLAEFISCHVTSNKDETFYEILILIPLYWPETGNNRPRISAYNNWKQKTKNKRTKNILLVKCFNFPFISQHVCQIEKVKRFKSFFINQEWGWIVETKNFFWEREMEGKDFLQSQQCAKWQTKKSEQICKIDKQIDKQYKKNLQSGKRREGRTFYEILFINGRSRKWLNKWVGEKKKRKLYALSERCFFFK